MSLVKVINFLFILCIATSANAKIIFSDTTPIPYNSSGDSYSKVINLDPNETFSNVILNVTAKGDYGFGQVSEYLDFFIDDIHIFHWTSVDTDWWSLDKPFAPFGERPFTIQENAFLTDYTVEGSFVFNESYYPADFWNNVASDNQVKISWQNGQGVTSLIDGGPDFVSFSLEGVSSISAVPEPSTYAMMLGVLVFMTCRKKIQKYKSESR